MKRIFSVKLDKALLATCAKLWATISFKLFNISNWNVATVQPFSTRLSPACWMRVQPAIAH